MSPFRVATIGKREQPWFALSLAADRGILWERLPELERGLWRAHSNQPTPEAWDVFVTEQQAARARRA